MGLRAPFLLSPPLTGVSCSPKDEGARGGPAGTQPGRLRHCRLSLGPDLHPEALVQPNAGGCAHSSGLGGSANWTTELSSPHPGPYLPLTTLFFSSPLGSTTVMATTLPSSVSFLLSRFCGGLGDASREGLCPLCTLRVVGPPGGGGARAFIFLLER